VTMQVFVRDHHTMIAAPIQCDVDGIPKGSHFARVPIEGRILRDANALSAALKWGRIRSDRVSAKCDLVEFRFQATSGQSKK
jgi:hypothetical protein